MNLWHHDPQAVADELREVRLWHEQGGRLDWTLVSGLLRRAQAVAAQAAALDDRQQRQCRGCGTPLTGRQRSWCGEACRSAWRRDRV